MKRYLILFSMIAATFIFNAWLGHVPLDRMFFYCGGIVVGAWWWSLAERCA